MSVLPRVTGGLTDEGARDPGILYDSGLLKGSPFYEPKHRRRGQLVHTAAHFIAQNLVDSRPSLDVIEDEWWSGRSGSIYYVHGQRIDDQVEREECRPYLQGVVNGLRENDIKVKQVELLVESQRLGYRGHIDWVATVQNVKAIVDLKTGAAAPWHPIQTALYALAYLEQCMSEGRGTPLPLRFVLYVGPTWGKSLYKLAIHKDPYDYKAAERFALAWHDREERYGR